MTGRHRRINVDARVESDGVCAIAAVECGSEHGGHALARPLVSEILLGVGSSTQAELIALRTAMELAASAGHDRVVFRADHRGAVEIANGRQHSQAETNPLYQLLRRHPEWRVVWVRRELNEAAHVMCSQTLRAWRAGRAGASTRERRGRLAA